jgi:uncharacterized protein (TIGR03546 family)
MLALLKLIQQLVQALNSEGTPGQVAAGIALGAALGLTPLASLHNLVVASLALLLNLSLAGFFLGWTMMVPVGFAADPLFDVVGAALLGSPALRPLWTNLANAPLVPLTNFNNSVVLGSLVVWLLALAPLWLLSRWAVATYRARVYERVKKTRAFQAVTASKLYNVYRWFRPQ